MTNREMLENRRHKIKPCSIDCGEFDPTTLTAFLCINCEYSFNHLLLATGSASSSFAKKPEIPAQTAIGALKAC
ncbi:hypothetical protein J4730_17065 [Klebsiella pneumoniae]|uniref:Uncharacterized protein n=1 Tax=Klebsiella pneumoniae TaxID=573 RepID=A0A939ST13_KLEPN|nr:hypothetical protein [Klebsiella pneumoniae]